MRAAVRCPLPLCADEPVPFAVSDYGEAPARDFLQQNHIPWRHFPELAAIAVEFRIESNVILIVAGQNRLCRGAEEMTSEMTPDLPQPHGSLFHERPTDHNDA